MFRRDNCCSDAARDHCAALRYVGVLRRAGASSGAKIRCIVLVPLLAVLLGACTAPLQGWYRPPPTAWPQAPVMYRVRLTAAAGAASHFEPLEFFAVWQRHDMDGGPAVDLAAIDDLGNRLFTARLGQHLETHWALPVHPKLELRTLVTAFVLALWPVQDWPRADAALRIEQRAMGDGRWQRRCLEQGRVVAVIGYHGRPRSPMRIDVRLSKPAWRLQLRPIALP